MMVFKSYPATLLGVLLLTSRVLSQLSRPPNMIIMADETIYFKDGETAELPCKATGEPVPIYTWERNEIKFEPSGNDDRWVQLPNEGTLVVNRPEEKDEGIYQCFANNQHGVALSLKINLRQAKLAPFPETKDRHITRTLGTPVTLPCTPPTSLPQPQVTWILRDQSGSFQVIDFDQHITMDHFGKLHITDLQAADASDTKAYVCLAINEFMRKNSLGESQYIHARGQESTNTPVEFLWRSPVDTKGLLGKQARMKCIFAGNPTPRVEWIRARGHIPRPRASVESFGMELVINDIRYEDAGEYECRANNDFSERPQSRTFIVSVQSAPKWDIKPKDVETSIGLKATFICKGSGEPRPNLVLAINGKKMKDVEPNSRRIIMEGFLGNSTYVNVTYINLTKSDTQVLQCNISNTNGYIFTNAYLNILEDPPEFVRPPHPLVKIAEGQSVRLTCQTTGKPDPIITWFKEGRPITGGRYMTQTNGDLIIMTVVLADAGHFGCEAVNKYGRVAANGTLIVRRRTRIEQRPLDLEVIAGNDAKFTCSATTDTDEVRQLQILWRKDDKPITPDNQRMTTNYQDNSLTVTGTIARDSGRFTCVATNSLDNATASAMLTVKGRPDPPTDVKIVPGTCLQDRATIEWSPGSNNNAPILYFYISYNTTFTPDVWTFVRQVEKSQFNADVPLSPWSNYTFRVEAVNKIGRSEPSAHTKQVCTTTDDVPFNNPANVRTIGEQKRALIVEWTEMPQIQHNGDGFVYLLLYKSKGSPDSAWVTNTIADYKQIRKVVDENLGVTDPYQPYEIQVKAHNTRGDARANTITYIGHTGEEEPRITPSGLQVVIDPSFDITSTLATLSWDPIHMSESNLLAVNGAFQGYRVQYWKSNEKYTTFREQAVLHSMWNSSREFCPTGQVCVQLKNLFPFSHIQAQVVVANNFYIGPPSPTISFQTKEGVPGPVKQFRALSAGPNHFLLDWQEPDQSDRNGIILGYDIAYQTVSGLDLGKMQDREPQLTDPRIVRTTLSGLRPKQKYRVHLWARTEKGRGEDYFIEVTTTKQGAPNAPTFTFAFIGEAMLNVTWQSHLASGENAGSIFYVEYRKKGASEWQRTPEESVNQWSNVTGLETGTVYEVRVVATTGTLVTPSAIQEVTTLGVGATQIAGSGWLIGMMLAIVFVLVIVILVCALVVFLRKNCEHVFHGGKDRDDEPDSLAPAAARTTASRPYTSAYSADQPAAYQYQSSAYPKPYSQGYYNQQFQYDEPPGEEESSSTRKSPGLNDSMEKSPPAYSDVDQDSFEEFGDHNEPEAGKFDEDGFIRSTANNYAPTVQYMPPPQEEQPPAGQGEPASPSAMSTFV